MVQVVGRNQVLHSKTATPHYNASLDIESINPNNSEGEIIPIVGGGTPRLHY